MLKFLIRLVLILFVFASGSVLFLFIAGESKGKQIKRNTEDTKASTVLAGRFIEHLIEERLDRMSLVAGQREQEGILNLVVQYADFVANEYGHKGSFMVGYMDSGFKVVTSINSTKIICPENTIINEEIAKTLLLEDIYVGPLSAKCAAESSDSSGMITMAVPLVDKDGLTGTVYEVSSILEYINSYKTSDYFKKFIEALILVDDIGRYPVGSREYKMLQLKDIYMERGVADFEERLLGFYSFSVQGKSLVLFYLRDKEASIFSFECCPRLEKYKPILFTAPLILLILWIILEMVRVNDRLTAEVNERTKHLDSLKNRYEGLFDTIPEFVVLMTKEGEILECNSRVEDIMQGGNPVGANMYFLLKEKERFAANIKRLTEEGVENFGEFLLAGKGEQVPVTVNACLVDIDDKQTILAVMTDMTSYKEMQDSFYKAQKREAVATLAAGMVHDFSNILQNISLQYTLLERSGDDREDKMRNIKEILEGANSYLTSVLSYTKEERDEIISKKGSAFVKGALELLERVMPAEISIRYFDSSSSIKIIAIQSKITQMLINLCQNASDAMDGRGEIIVKTYIEQKPYGNFFCISISDTGSGINQEDIDKIYKPFYTTKKGRGTGLGLATVKQVVVEFGGFIEVRSQPGEGTKFTIMFSESK